VFKRIQRGLSDRARALSWRWLNFKQGFLLRRLRLQHALPTGISIPIESMADWSMYNDIFVSGEYDIAIRRALGEANGCCRVVDLGANVGLFAKRLLHLRRSEFSDTALELICVEGLNSTYRSLQKSFPSLRPDESAQLVHGLAGERTGSASIKPNAFHAMTSLSHGERGSGIEVSFIDLENITSSWDEIDLLKCDIEGSENLVLRTYPSLIARIKTAVFEFHLDRVDLSDCRKRLSEGGLSVRHTLHENEYISVELFRRRNAARLT